MTITIDLEPAVERGLAERARAKGISLADYAQEILVRESGPSTAGLSRTGQDLIDACAHVRGLLTDEEVDRVFMRSSATSRPVDFS